MSNLISPKYLMALVKQIHDAIWEEYKTYKEVKLYINKWHIVEEDWNNHWENFTIKLKDGKEIDLLETLHNIDGDTLLKIAIDMGVETPDFIPSIPTFRNEIKSDYKTASATFEKAFKDIEEHPNLAIGLANSALESILKEILKDNRLKTLYDEKKTTYDLTVGLLKEFQLFPNSDLPIEIRTIGSALLSASQSIEKLRSTKTVMHGKASDEYVVSDSLYTYFVINSITTIGLFLKSYYIKKFPKVTTPAFFNPSPQNIDDLPF